MTLSSLVVSCAQSVLSPLNLLLGGATACIVAGRLAAADSTLKILVRIKAMGESMVFMPTLLPFRSSKMDREHGTSPLTFSQQDILAIFWTRLQKLFWFIKDVQARRLVGGHLLFPQGGAWEGVRAWTVSNTFPYLSKRAPIVWLQSWCILEQLHPIMMIGQLLITIPDGAPKNWYRFCKRYEWKGRLQPIYSVCLGWDVRRENLVPWPKWSYQGLVPRRRI